MDTRVRNFCIGACVNTQSLGGDLGAPSDPFGFPLTWLSRIGGLIHSNASKPLTSVQIGLALDLDVGLLGGS